MWTLKFSPESICWPLGPVCWFDIDVCNLCMHLVLSTNLKHWPMLDSWCLMPWQQWWRSQFINRSTHFIRLATLLIDKCVFRLVAIAQSLDTYSIRLNVVQIEFHVMPRFSPDSKTYMYFSIRVLWPFCEQMNERKKEQERRERSEFHHRKPVKCFVVTLLHVFNSIKSYYFYSPPSFAHPTLIPSPILYSLSHLD